MAKVSEIKKTIQKGEKVTLVTHAGNFHSDDVCATALLQLYFYYNCIETEVVRTFTPADMGYTDETPNCVVYDIGLGMYDHHQIGADAEHCIRIDTTPDGETVIRKYSSVGLLWKEIGEEFVGKYADVVYDSIIRHIDDHDNGFGHNPLSSMIKNMNSSNPKPTNDDHNRSFECAVETIGQMLDCTILKYRAQIKSEKLARLYINGKSCIVTPLYMSGADEVCRENEIAFYVYPNDRGGWCFKTICPDPKDMSKHFVDIPDEVRNWDGVTFLHPSCFLGSAITKERAVEICNTLYNKSICND